MAHRYTYYLVDTTTNQIWAVKAYSEKHALGKYILKQRPHIKGSELIDAIYDIQHDIFIVMPEDIHELYVREDLPGLQGL